MSNEIWIGTVRVFGEGIEGCEYENVDCALLGTYTQSRKVPRQSQLISVAHKRRNAAEAAAQNPGIGTSVIYSQSCQ